MPDNSAYLAFLRDPDQEARWAELRTFFGPNADSFLPAYKRLRESTAAMGRPKFQFFSGFEVAAFFLGPVWFFYRKMWLMAWLIVGMLVIVAFLPFRTGGLIIGVLLATMAHRTYVQYAVQKIVKLHASGTPVTPARLEAEGGVSRQAGVISGVVFVLVWLLGVAAVVYLAMHGVDPTRS